GNRKRVKPDERSGQGRNERHLRPVRAAAPQQSRRCSNLNAKQMSEAALGLLKRDYAITLVALTTLCVLAWLFIVTGAGLGASAWDMTTFALFPHRHAIDAAAGMPGMAMDGSGTGRMASAPAWSLGAWTPIIAMWWTMMIAM